MRILQIGKFYPVQGGVEKVMYDLTVGLSERGVHCDMLCTTSDKDSRGDIVLNAHATIFRVPFLVKVAATMIAPAMITRLRKIQSGYDIIHIHHPDPMACLALFLSGYKGTVVLHWHSDILKQGQLLKFYKPLQSWLIGRAQVIVGTTPIYIRESPFLKRAQQKTAVIPIGIPEQARNSGVATRLKEKFVGKKIIFALGRLVKYKGFEYLIKAARLLGEEYVVLIGGKGELQKELEALIEAEGTGGRVRLVGCVSDEELPGYFEACDLFCLSSIWKTEAFAIAQVEAMSFGKPVVATRIPASGVSWVNADGVSGLNVEPEDSVALADAIRRILTDKVLYEKFSDGARQRYETMFTQPAMVDRCLELYGKLN
ncbi:MAG: glycosyltransferase [Mediterranea sp.]|nr:glycosyltransferase [Mediterranea sp.]